MASIGLTSVGGFYTEIGFGPRVVGVMAVNEFGELCRIDVHKKVQGAKQYAQVRRLQLSKRSHGAYGQGKT